MADEQLEVEATPLEDPGKVPVLNARDLTFKGKIIEINRVAGTLDVVVEYTEAKTHFRERRVFNIQDGGNASPESIQQVITQQGQPYKDAILKESSLKQLIGTEIEI